MNRSNYTGRTHRTTQSAFGPYTSHDLQPMREPRSPWQSHDLAVACILLLAIVLIVVGLI